MGEHPHPIVARIGEKAMGAVETGCRHLQEARDRGRRRVVAVHRRQAQDLKDTVMAQIQDFVVIKIIKAGIAWLIGLLNRPRRSSRPAR